MTAFAFTNSKLPLILTKRSRLLKLPESITRNVINDFCRWTECNGSAWAVDRMKIIKQIILNSVSSNRPIPLDFWIKKRNAFHLGGHYGQLQDIALSGDKGLKQVLRFLNMYTVFVQLETTEKAVQKLRETVETVSDVDPRVFDTLSKDLRLALKRVGFEYHLNRGDVTLASLYEQAGEMKTHQEDDYLQAVESIFRTPWGMQMIANHPCVFTPLMNCLGFRGYRGYNNPEVMGKVFRIPSPGLKDRWVCDFNKALDHCLKPLGKRIYESVAKLPWDITFDESKCYSGIQNHLNTGLEIFSFDLSSATDRFPWKLQLEVLREFSQGQNWQDMVNLYAECIEHPALLPDGSTITWKQGQPLGAYPSFAVFTFTHGLLLYALNGGKWDGSFYIHGDDLVVLDPRLAKSYAWVMSELKVKVSPFKTLRSRKLAMINSKVITKDHIFSIPKWKPISRRNALGQLRNWGPKVIDFLRLKPQEERAIMKIAALPVQLGGAGINPQGVPLEVRLEGMEDVLFKEKELSYEGSFRSKVLKRYLQDPEKNKNFLNLLGNALDAADKADQARLNYYREQGVTTVIGGSADLDILGKNAYSVNPDMSIPVKSETPDTEAPDEVTREFRRLKKLDFF